MVVTSSFDCFPLANLISTAERRLCRYTPRFSRFPSRAGPVLRLPAVRVSRSREHDAFLRLHFTLDGLHLPARDGQSDNDTITRLYRGLYRRTLTTQRSFSMVPDTNPIGVHARAGHTRWPSFRYINTHTNRIVITLGRLRRITSRPAGAHKSMPLLPNQSKWPSWPRNRCSN